ncbi:ubiquinol-cytochrome c reductase cytochrome b subunit [Actinomadura sp. WMMB 499]|uniref:cytochrome bc1 complex cytochrome b subunit n=1 Tax=Actinomadura sp. WMMB 499 TaxID=1219491 RepID=UPI0012483A1E|nr:ubiquinol-cytochrome c reductase cytochrome b subunit [Actinomadura sp. WMMB 499]QFG26034.1 ubiquinol-cytochrome c reductase cytochrome b subunit [Actinomadura sp. WMMB 499]
MAQGKGGPKAGRLEDLAWGVDGRLGSGAFLRRNLTKAFPKHWSFLLGEIALYSFIVLVITGVFLTLFFKPSGAEIVYDGSYPQLRGREMSEAYASTLHITFDIRGGLLMRQIHHWAANIFLAAIAIHLMRIFFTGAFRKPREINWLIGVTLFVLALAEGFAGYSLPDDLLSGTGLRIMSGIVQSIPVAGTYLVMFVFGGEFPGTEEFIPRLYMVHILLVPALLLALITAHLMLLWHQTHTQWPGKGRREQKVTGEPTYPVFAAQSGAYFLFTFGLLALISAAFQINPVWLYGPYQPDEISFGSQPDWYVGFLEGSLRIMPPLETTLWGHTVSWNVLVPAVLLPGAFFTLLAMYPFFERWATGDERVHHLLDRPRNAATRTAIGAAVIAWYGNLWAAGGNDVIAWVFHIPLFWTTWFFRIGFLVFPVVAFVVTRRICLSLQRRDLRQRTEGVESGLISLTPGGGFTERHERSTDEHAALLRTRQPRELLAAYPHHILPMPTPGRVRTQARTRANHFYLDYQVLSQGGGQGRADGAPPRRRAEIEGTPPESAGERGNGSRLGRLRALVGKRRGNG